MAAARLVGTAMPENHLGARAGDEAGYEPVGTVGCLRLGSLQDPGQAPSGGYLGAAHRLRIVAA